MNKNEIAKQLHLCVGKKIKQKRKELKLSQEKLGEIINVGYIQVHRYEKGIRKIPLDKLLELAKFFNVPLEYFYSNKNGE